MNDLIGRFLSFEERMGKGLVKVTYYVALFFLVVVTLFNLIRFLFAGDFGHFFLTPFVFLIRLLMLRLASEVVLAILSIDDNLRHSVAEPDGFESGLTPTPSPEKPAPKPEPPVAPSSAATTAQAEPSFEGDDEVRDLQVEEDDDTKPSDDKDDDTRL
ncbi:DUF4282 domain-containing protein [Parvularcula sp. LCG005]|uniref:DUF4282 domain-containing protein n=1 Tax=Parvularcula sp. LCG005 TaxID=3078805 RepID=UPI0029434617|nr:DUF4282 domain-containing protein [Parvularcula sp. LCG005]WOI53322.1 DUF4282 domain-containing protein [Parvularcula sp. LCG005]